MATKKIKLPNIINNSFCNNKNSFNTSLLSTPPSSNTTINNNNNNNNTHHLHSKNKILRQHAKDADAGATGDYLTVTDISLLRDVCTSAPAQQISVALTDGTCAQSTHHGVLDVLGHGAMIAYLFPQIEGALLPISQLVKVELRVTYSADSVTCFDGKGNAVRANADSVTCFDGKGNAVRANADSGATGNYLTVADIGVLRDVCISAPAQRIAVAVANGTLLQSTHHGFLDVPGHGPMIAYIFPQLKGSLLSISQLVNVGLRVTYCADFVTGVDTANNTVFQGNRDDRTGLWMVDLRSLSTSNMNVPNVVATHSAASAVRLDSVAEFVKFWHATYGSPAVSTFLAAIDKSFIRVPGLTSAKVRRHPPDTLATAYGHLHATRKGIRSTKKTLSPVIPTSTAKSDDNVDSVSPLPRERRVWFEIHEVRAGRAHSDATGAMPQRGRSGALYQIVFYHEDSNVIHIETTRSRSGPDLLAALQRAVKFFTDRGAAPLLVRMDNECAVGTKNWLATTSIKLELTPVAQHRTNKAERAISTWKDHFIATLATTDPNCPLSLWEDFVEQAELTLNCMRGSPVHPLLSAWEALCGRFDVLATPIAPPWYEGPRA